MDQLHDILLAPVVTEKSANAAEDNTYVFKVGLQANKHQIKDAVENFFGVRVSNVRTLIVRGKMKRFGSHLGRRSNLKKAYVTLRMAIASTSTPTPARPEGTTMGIRKFKPTSAGRRFMSVSDFAGVSKKAPERSLLAPMKSSGGRNNRGRITVRRRGGGHKRRYRIIDFKRDKWDVPGKVAAVEYDPNRSARIALIHFADGEKRYVLHPLNLNVGDSIVSSNEADIKPGNSMQLHAVPLGTWVHNVELTIGRGGQVCRSAGSYAQVMAKEGNYVLLRMPSSELRQVHRNCQATIGQVGNLEHENQRIGKAGRSRWLGRRPKVRGSAMNPVDHPHGGGEGRTTGGRHPVTPWGKPTKGRKTRSKKKPSNRFIVKRRK